MSTSKSEQSYIRSSLLADPPLRADGRDLLDYRPIALETQVAPLANGSAQVSIGGAALNGVGGGLPSTEVLAAVKLEVEDVTGPDVVDGGRMVCSVSCFPSAYPHLTNNALDDLQSDLSSVLHETLSHPSLHPKNLSIIPGKRSWLLHLDAVILSDSGNVYDALFLAAAAALRDTRVPRTRGVEYRAPAASAARAVERDAGEDVVMRDVRSGLDTRAAPKVTDFELTDYWDEGEPLQCGGSWPVCITLNLVSPRHFLDATLQEEDATPLRLLLFFAFPGSPASYSETRLQGMRLLGSGEADRGVFKGLIRVGEKYARELKKALDAKLQAEQAKWYPQLKKKGRGG